MKTWSPRLLTEVGTFHFVLRRNGNSCKAMSHGFGPESSRKNKKRNSVPRLDEKQYSRKQLEKNSGPDSQERSIETPLKDSYHTNAPNFLVGSNAQQSSEETSNSFEERLQAIRRSAQLKKKLDEEKIYGPIDYDAPTSKSTTKEGVSLPVKVGIGIVVVVFGIAFAFGDLLPSGQFDAQKTNTSNLEEMSSEDIARLKEQLQGFEAILKIHPEDLAAIEGAAVTYAELGELSKSETELQKLLEKRHEDFEALRLLGEVQTALAKFEQSAATYRKALKVHPEASITLLRGLVKALILEGRPNEAVQEIIAIRDKLKANTQDISHKEDNNGKADEVDPVQIELLLGKAYSDWDHVRDAVAVYESIITNYPEDFRGYLAKAILLKEQGQKGEAERMFIQARYLAPENMKALVDHYSRP